MPAHEFQREEMNFIAQRAALYSANPISSVLEDQIECARAHSRGAVDYDAIVRRSLYSDARTQQSVSPEPAGNYGNPRSINGELTPKSPPPRLSPEKGVNQMLRHDIRTAG